MLIITLQDAVLHSYLQQLQARLGDLSPVLDEIGNTLETNTRKRFRTFTDPEGNKWDAWQPNTRKRYPFPGTPTAKKYGAGNARLLDRHGTMLGGLSYQVGKRSVTVGFADPYAVFHEFGTKRMARRGMLTTNPERGTLGPTDKAEVLEILNHWLRQVT